jgi:hypothetical protein
MRVYAEIPIALAVGGGLFAGTHILWDYFNMSPHQSNEQVMACASQLGRTAITTTNPPSECNKYFDVTIFNSKTTTVDEYNAATGNTTETSKTEYYLPTKKNFISSNITTSSEARSQEFRENIFVNGFAGVVALLAIASTMSAPRIKKQKSI